MSIIIESDVLQMALAFAPTSKEARGDKDSIAANSRFRTIDGALEVVQSLKWYTVVQRVEAMGDLAPVCIASHTLSALSRLSSGLMTMTLLDNGRVAVESDSSVHRMPVRPAARFPPVPVVKGEPCYIRGDVLRRMIEHAVFALDKNPDDGRGIQNLYIKVEGGVLTMVSTDTHRMMVLTYDGVGIAADFTILLPRASADAFAKFAGQREHVALVADDNHCRIASAASVPNQPGEVWKLDETGNSVYSIVSASPYVRWEPLAEYELPEEVEVDVDALILSIKRANVAAESHGTTKSIQLWTFGEEELKIEARVIEEAMECEEVLPLVGGPVEPISIGVSGTQILEFLNHLMTAKVCVRFKDENTLLHFCPNVRGSFGVLYVKVPAQRDYAPAPATPPAPKRVKGKGREGAE